VLPSVELRDTVTLKEVDTITLVKDRFRVKIMRSYDTLIIDGGCDGDTIIRVLKVPVETLIYKEEHKIFRWSFYLWIVFIVLAFIYRFFSVK